MTTSRSTPFRVLIVDDEPPARARLRGALSREPDFEVVGEAEDGPGAIEQIGELVPDLVFLDIRMPGMDGFAVLRELHAETAPYVVFVTAYSDRAVEAFQVHALDYLMKPFDDARFGDMLAHVRERLGENGGEGDSSGDDDATEAAEGAEAGEEGEVRSFPARRIRVQEGQRTRFIPVDDVEYLSADGNYVVVHAGPKEYRIRTTLSAMGRKLDRRQFIRIHRSHMVNIEALREIQPWFSGDYLAILNDGTELRVSRNYRDRILRPTL